MYFELQILLCLSLLIYMVSILILYKKNKSTKKQEPTLLLQNPC